jgi:transmembrane sensor
MTSKRLREEWNVIPNRGMLPNEIKSRMWKNIRNASIDKYKIFYNWTAAACIVFIVSITGYYNLNQLHYSKTQTASVKTLDKDIRLLCLPDGTRVWLNQNTEIEYPSEFSGKDRKITLKGEAFFEVKRDVAHPFIISSGSIKTTVLGTSFTIKAYNNDQSEVNVRTGKVKVESDENTVFLIRGDKAVYKAETSILNKQKSNVLEPQWKKVLVYVDDLTLEQVLDKLKTDHDFEINYADENLKNLKMQGTLDMRQTFYETLQTIAFALEIKIKSTGKNKYQISR